MKATIKTHLVHPTRNGHKIVSMTIYGKTQEECENKANEFIYNRCQNNSYIPVNYFDVEISTNKNRILNSWKYTPTYQN